MQRVEGMFSNIHRKRYTLFCGIAVIDTDERTHCFIDVIDAENVHIVISCPYRPVVLSIKLFYSKITHRPGCKTSKSV